MEEVRGEENVIKISCMGKNQFSIKKWQKKSGGYR